MSARTFINMAKQKFASKAFRQGLESSVDDVLADKKKYAIQAGLVAGVAIPTAQSQGIIDLTSEETKDKVKKIAIGGSVIVGALGAAKAAKLAGRLLNKTKETPWKNVIRTGVTETHMTNMDNTLMPNPLAPDKIFSFYGGGAGAQIGAVAEEGWSALRRSASRFFDVETSIASKRVPGVNARMVEQIDTLEKIAQETELGLKSMVKKQGEKGYATELEDVLAPLKQAVKVVHHKVVNDYSNSGIFNEYFKENTLVSDYVRRFLKAETYGGLVKQASVARGIGKESIDNMLKVQGLKTPIEKMKYVQLSGAGVRMGDMLRDIQFDPRVYNVFQSIGKKGLTKTDDVYKAMKEFFPHTKKLKNGKLQIIMSPKMKSNFDWGGSAGSVTWDPKFPDKVKFFSTDARDLFGMKLGDDVINVSTIKEIKMPKFIEKMKKETNKPTRGKDLGFKQTITQDDKSYYRGQIEQPTIDKDGNLVLYGREDELYKRAGLPSKGVSMTDDLKSAIEYGNGQMEGAQLRFNDVWGYDINTWEAERALEELSENGYYLIQTPKKIANEIVKEAGEVKVIGDKIIIPKGQYKVEQVIDGMELNPELAKQRIKPQLKRAEKRPKQYREMDINSINIVSDNTLIGKDDYERLRNISAQFNKAKKDVLMHGATNKEIIEFIGTRGATVSGGMAGLYGAYALASKDDE